MDEFGELDAVITGCALEYAITTLEVLQQGRRAADSFSTEMLCTLDNFIKVVLLSDRTFVTGVADMRGNEILPREPRVARPDSRRVLERLNVELQPPPGKGDADKVFARIAQVLAPAGNGAHFVIKCEFPEQRSTIFQEMVATDPYFIEYAIEQFGAQRFKAVFPGEHLYLALRAVRAPKERYNHTLADLVAMRSRKLVASELEKLNRFARFGAPYIAPLPPIFVTKLIERAGAGGHLGEALVKMRNDRSFANMRNWVKQTMALARSSDINNRRRAGDALTSLENYDFARTNSARIFKEIRTALQLLRGDFAGATLSQAEEIANALARRPLQGLDGFSNASISQGKLEKFLSRSFGDKFRRNELNGISMLLGLADNLDQWSDRTYKAECLDERVEDAPPLARPYQFWTEDPDQVDDASRDFDELWEQSEPLTPELLAKWEADRTRQNPGSS